MTAKTDIPGWMFSVEWLLHCKWLTIHNSPVVVAWCWSAEDPHDTPAYLNCLTEDLVITSFYASPCSYCLESSGQYSYRTWSSSLPRIFSALLSCLYIITSLLFWCGSGTSHHTTPVSVIPSVSFVYVSISPFSENQVNNTSQDQGFFNHVSFSPRLLVQKCWQYLKVLFGNSSNRQCTCAFESMHYQR